MDTAHKVKVKQFSQTMSLCKSSVSCARACKLMLANVSFAFSGTSQEGNAPPLSQFVELCLSPICTVGCQWIKLVGANGSCIAVLGRRVYDIEICTDAIHATVTVRA